MAVPREKSIREAAEALAKRSEWERTQPPGPLVHLRCVHVMSGDGSGTTVYLGKHRGAGYVGLDLRGFNGWRSYPSWMPGGWEFFEPRLYVGRLFMDRGRSYGLGTVLLPASIVSFYRWKVSPRGRRYMREHGHDRPAEAESSDR